MAKKIRILDRYRLVERLALGGSAEVWRAHDEQLDRPVAVKRLHPHLLPDEASRRRLAAEARAAAALAHPAIVSVYDVDTTADAAALVMELVEGESLAARIDREGALPERDAVEIVADISDGLYHAHQRGVIHRDVKPGNILLDETGKARLVDFGIARSLAESAERLTLTGTVIGTLRYMAPEQLAGRETGPRTDLYGLGAVLHEALTGRSPYPSASPVALARAQAAGPPPMDDVDPALAAVTRACLALEPMQRPLHAGALAIALREWLDGKPESALAMAAHGAALAAAAADPNAPTQAIPVARSIAASTPAAAVAPLTGRRRGWMPTVMAAVVGALAVGVVAFAVIGPGDGTAFGLGPTPTASPTPTATPTATPMPEWMEKLLEDYVEECGDANLSTVEAEIAGAERKEAEDYVKGLIEDCKDARDGGPGRGNGRGRGGGGDDD